MELVVTVTPSLRDGRQSEDSELAPPTRNAFGWNDRVLHAFIRGMLILMGDALSFLIGVAGRPAPAIWIFP